MIRTIGDLNHFGGLAVGGLSILGLGVAVWVLATQITLRTS